MNFPSFSEGLSLREARPAHTTTSLLNFPSFSEGLSLRVERGTYEKAQFGNFPSFSEGLSLRALMQSLAPLNLGYFPSFSEGLSLRALNVFTLRACSLRFPFLFGGTFIEGHAPLLFSRRPLLISLPFRRDFH